MGIVKSSGIPWGEREHVKIPEKVAKCIEINLGSVGDDNIKHMFFTDWTLLERVMSYNHFNTLYNYAKTNILDYIEAIIDGYEVIPERFYCDIYLLNGKSYFKVKSVADGDPFGLLEDEIMRNKEFIINCIRENNFIYIKTEDDGTYAKLNRDEIKSVKIYNEFHNYNIEI